MRSIGASNRGLGRMALGTTLGTNLGPSRTVRRERYSRLVLTGRDTCQLDGADKPAYPGGGGVGACGHS